MVPLQNLLQIGNGLFCIAIPSRAIDRVFQIGDLIQKWIAPVIFEDGESLLFGLQYRLLGFIGVAPFFQLFYEQILSFVELFVFSLERREIAFLFAEIRSEGNCRCQH